MDRLKEMLRKNQTMYFVVMAVFVVGAIFTISFSGQIAQWLTLALLTIICLLATSITIVFATVVKDKYKTNIEQAVSSQLEQLMLVKDELQQMQHQLQAEQVKHVQLLESKLNNIEEIQVLKMKELQLSLELNKQLAVTKITEEMTEQFSQLTSATTSHYNDSKQQIETVQQEMNVAFVKQQAQGESLQKAVEHTKSELVTLSMNQHEQAYEQAQQHASALTKIVNEATQQSIEQTSSSEKLLTEILTTLSKNILMASNMMKDSLSKQHAETLSHIDNVDTVQQKRVQESFDALTERVVYILDQINSNSKAAATQLDEQTTAILADLKEKYSAAATVFHEKGLADKALWNELIEKSEVNFSDLTAMITKNVQDVHQQLKHSHEDQSSSLSKAVQTVVDTVQVSKSDSLAEYRAQYEQLQAEIQLANKQQETMFTQTGEMLQQEVVGNFTVLLQNVSELQAASSQQLVETKHAILGSVNELTSLSAEQHGQTVAQVKEQLHTLGQQQADNSADIKKAMLAQVISVGNDVVEGFQQFGNATTTQSNSLHATIAELQQQLTEEYNNTYSQIGKLQQLFVEAPEQQQQYLLHLQNALQEKMDKQLMTSQKEWQEIKSQQVVQLTEVRAFVEQQITEQQRQTKEHQSSFALIEKVIEEAKDSLQQPLQQITQQLTQLQKAETTERQGLQSQLQTISGNVNELNAQLLQQLAGVKLEVSKNNVAALQQQLKTFEQQLNQLKTSVTASKIDISKQIQSFEQLVKNYERSSPELKQILQSVVQITGQFKDHEVLVLDRIDGIDMQLKAMQQVSTSPAVSKTTKSIPSETNMAAMTKVAVQTLTKPEEKPKNRTDIIEDKANGITMHNKYVNGVLMQSDMLQNGKISYSAFYNARGVVEKTVNFDKNGKRQTEMIYYPNGAVKERIEYVTVKGKSQKEITKFSMDGKRLN